ncbi:unnamed protein product [Bursaphelenchus xylophilus]|uniref:(pine wood nematode) hypothetical protein n=1 Tax=Bursaphelenchus xylophilus TaxID=6326 RepID=A0A1I7SQ70_BURXY|nr:unnamed protein product [Bursaphelenchus xylophilus]CAG9109669.1 unnamed protein product [Bursaphelenchus xylophilus]
MAVDYSDDGVCGENYDTYFHRQYIDLFLSCLGLFLSTVHLTLLIYIRYAQKHKGFFLMLIQAFISVLTMAFLIFGCIIDLCAVRLNSILAFFRAYIWLFLVNALIATYGFIVVALCLDRYVALNNPLYYKLCFSKLRARILITSVCCVVAAIVCFKWLIYNKVEGGDGFVENEVVTSTLWYNVIKTISALIQYFVSGVVMILLSVSIITKLKELDYQHSMELRLAEGSMNEWTKHHRTTANICIFLTFSYIACNWPYALADYFYTPELSETIWYGSIEVIINIFQLLYLQLNIFFFAYCSHIYRQNLCFLTACTTKELKKLISWQRKIQITENKSQNNC